MDRLSFLQRGNRSCFSLREVALSLAWLCLGTVSSQHSSEQTFAVDLEVT